jgi:hypothetical protein
MNSTLIHLDFATACHHAARQVARGYRQRRGRVPPRGEDGADHRPTATESPAVLLCSRDQHMPS